MMKLFCWLGFHKLYTDESFHRCSRCGYSRLTEAAIRDINSRIELEEEEQSRGTGRRPQTYKFNGGL